MKHEDAYHRWTQARTRTDIRPDFADRVMNQVLLGQSRASQSPFRWARLAEQVSVSLWAKAAAIAIGSLLGLGRVLLTLHLLLSV